MTLPKRRSTHVGKATLSMLTCGPADGPRVLLLHGIPASAELWRDVLIELGNRGFCCAAPDLIGYGHTAVPPNADHSLPAAAKLMSDWLAQERWQDVWLICHDIGGGVGQLLLTRDPARFARATFSNVITDRTWPVAIIRMMMLLARRGLFAPLAATGLFSTAAARLSLRGTVFNKSRLNAQTVSRIFFDTKVTDPDGRAKFQRMLAALDPQHTADNMAAVRKLALPVHLLWAMDDPYQPWSGPGEILHGIFPQARVTRLNRAGHYLQIDTPEAYLDALLAD